MADVVNITSKDNGSDDGNGKGEIDSTTNKVIDLLDDDDCSKTVYNWRARTVVHCRNT